MNGDYDATNCSSKENQSICKSNLLQPSPAHFYFENIYPLKKHFPLLKNYIFSRKSKLILLNDIFFSTKTHFPLNKKSDNFRELILKTHLVNKSFLANSVLVIHFFGAVFPYIFQQARIHMYYVVCTLYITSSRCMYYSGNNLCSLIC